MFALFPRLRLGALSVLVMIILMATSGSAQAQYSHGQPILPPFRGTLMVTSGDPHYLLAYGYDRLRIPIEVEVKMYSSYCTVTIDGVVYQGEKSENENGALGCSITEGTDKRLPKGLEIFVDWRGQELSTRDTETGQRLLVFEDRVPYSGRLLLEVLETVEGLGIFIF